MPDHATGLVDRDALLAALADLTPWERAVIVLRYQQDLTEAATADQLGVRVGTVKSSASRAMAKLRRSPDLVATHQGRTS